MYRPYNWTLCVSWCKCFASGVTTDSDEEVIFVREKPGRKVPKLAVDWGFLQALQRDIDYESLQHKSSTSYGNERLRSVCDTEVVENMKMTVEESKIKVVKKAKKQKKEEMPKNTMESKVKTDKMIGEMPENKAIKKRKRENSTDTAATNDLDPEVDQAKKKKKMAKKKRHTEATDCVHEDDPVKDKEKVERKSMQTESNVETVKIEEVGNIIMDNVQEKNKKLKKAKKAEQIVNTETKKKDKKKKKLLAEDNISAIESWTTKKKKKSKRSEKESKLEFSEKSQIENVRVKKKEKKDKYEAEENEGLTDKNKEETQLKKKKNKKSNEELDTAVERKKCRTEKAFVDPTSEPEPKKKRSKRKESENDAIMEGKQKKRSKKEENTIDTEDNGQPKKIKKKVKEEQLDPEELSQVEVVFLSEKTGNADEVHVNKERRQALQKEIDQASQPQKPAKSMGLGQWSTAEFGNAEQQQKFLRLMGGFKKGFQPAASSSGGGNMAMGKVAQQQLQQGLMGDFERAHSRRLDMSGRGAGLGFMAPSKKKFSIDANVTRSIRFDD